MIGPNCRCADLGLNYCEIGDEELCLKDELEELDMLETSKNMLSALPTGTGKGPARRACIHSLDAYELENGQTVYLSALLDSYSLRDWVPDIGIYFDGGWDRESESFTYLVPWADYGLPLVKMEIFDRYIRTAFEHMNGGETVDIGCVGCHGRTGTFLACLDIASSDAAMSASDAIRKVRREHCFSAIETDEQEWFVSCYRAYLRGEDMPPKPERKLAIKGNSKSVKYDSTTGTVTYIGHGHYDSDYVWSDDPDGTKSCVEYTNPTTGNRWVLDGDGHWAIDESYIPTWIPADNDDDNKDGK